MWYTRTEFERKTLFLGTSPTTLLLGFRRRCQRSAYFEVCVYLLRRANSRGSVANGPRSCTCMPADAAGVNNICRGLAQPFFTPPPRRTVHSIMGLSCERGGKHLLPVVSLSEENDGSTTFETFRSNKWIGFVWSNIYHVHLGNLSYPASHVIVFSVLPNVSLPCQLLSLRDALRQRDNEIAILVNMLKQVCSYTVVVLPTADTIILLMRVVQQS